METAEAIPRRSNDSSIALPDRLFEDELPISYQLDSKVPSPPKTESTEPDLGQPQRPPKYAVAPPLKPLRGTFKLLQLWEGRILEVREREFVAVIADRTNPKLNDEQVTLELEEITKEDVPLVKPGAVFYWSIGYADHPGRPRVRESRIRFRRLPTWTQAELDRAKEAAKRLSRIFPTD